ncbi:MAG: hypothetical protein QOC92_261 [Acidimicrobiaceae bacterium]
MFPTDYAIDVPTLARACEERGFESLFVPEHTHIPSSRRTPWPGGPELPKEYSHSLDPFVSLGAAAAVTDRLLLGTGICLVVERDPITLAKEVASLDHLSNGRFLFGIGGGWNREEMENHGTDPRQRWDILRERIEAMKAIWANDNAEYHGKHVDFDPIWSWPKPVQRPHPPIIIGGSGATTFDRILSYGDEWRPIMGRGPAIVDQIGDLQKRAADQGRGPIPVSAFAAPPKAAALEGLAEAGVTRAVFFVPPAGRDVVLPLLDEYASLL